MGDYLSTPEVHGYGYGQHQAIQQKYDCLDEPTKRIINKHLKKQSELEHEKRQLLDLNDRLKKSEQYLTKENQTLKQELKKLQSRDKHQYGSSNVQSVTSEVLEKCLGQQTALEAERKEMGERLERMQKEMKILTDDIQKLTRDNKVLSTEKENALSRLSKVAGIQLTKGNSDIADLSDANRPTKLGEKWSSLYTEEWMEAYDEIKKGRTLKNENFVVEKELCKIVQECYETCQSIERKQMKDIKCHIWDIACCLHQQPDQLVSAVKTTQYHQVVKEDDGAKAATNNLNQKQVGLTSNIRAIQRCMEELIQIVHERRKYDKQLLEYVQQVTLRKFEKYTKPGSTGQVVNFVKRCTELCWNMVIKEPPMILLFDQPEGTPIDKNMFAVYTKNGAIVDYVIWPALMLSKTGPVLAKGTVQGKDAPVSHINERKESDVSRRSSADTATNVKEGNGFAVSQNSTPIPKEKDRDVSSMVRQNSVEKKKGVPSATFIKDKPVSELGTAKDPIKVIVPEKGGNGSIRVKEEKDEQ